MSRFVKVLTWPAVSLLITGALHFTLEAIWPDLKATFVPAVLATLLLAYGTWLGFLMVRAGGTFPEAVAAGAVLGLLPVALDLVGFGVILGRGTDAATLAAAFGWGMVVFGSLLGAGFRESVRAVAVERPDTATRPDAVPAMTAFGES